MTGEIPEEETDILNGYGNNRHTASDGNSNHYQYDATHP